MSIIDKKRKLKTESVRTGRRVMVINAFQDKTLIVYRHVPLHKFNMYFIPGFEQTFTYTRQNEQDILRKQNNIYLNQNV